MTAISKIIKSTNLNYFVTLLAIPLLVMTNEIYAAESCNKHNAESAVSCAYELPDGIIEALKIDAGFGWGIFNGSIYNGNEKYTITQLNVSMEPIHDHHHMEMMGDMHHAMSHEVKVHEIKMNLRPLTKGAISMALPNEDVHIHDFKWEVVKVFGYAEQ